MSAKIFELFQQLKHDYQDRKTQSVAWRTRRGKAAKAFVLQPMVHSVGSAQQGLHLAAGNFLVSGRLIRDPKVAIWNVESDNEIFQNKAQNFFWLDHLCANASNACNVISRKWFADWLVQFGDGDNLAWTPELAGARIIRLINHAIVLLGNTTERDQKNYFSSISHHARFLKKRWQYAPEGLPKFLALVGYVYSALALEDFTKDLKPALHALNKECDIYIADDGGISTRSPEELLEIFTLLVWVAQGVTSASQKPGYALLSAIDRIAPAIRTLRMGDGRLVEFHGGQALSKQRIDQILSDSGLRGISTLNNAMGYSRIENATSLLVIDAGAVAKPIRGIAASGCTLAFEFSSGQCLIFKSVGSGRDLDDRQRQTSQTAAGYSVASIKPIFPLKTDKSSEPVQDIEVISMRNENDENGTVSLSTSHTGYRRAFGLTYNRNLELSANGRALSGSDHFMCKQKKDQGRFDKVVTRQVTHSIPFVSKFHIAPGVDAELDLGGTAVSMRLPNNEVWIFKVSGGNLVLEDSMYFSSERLRPRATKQIVVTSHIVNYEGAVNWVLTRLES